MSQESSLPVLAVSIIGILATSILLLSYYIFVTNCCRSWRRFGFVSHLSISGLRRRRDLHFALCSNLIGSHGLNECAIQVIPSFRFRKDELRRSFRECAVCLNEFREEERIRMLPNCFHAFHIDCIDTWLQTHESCPICRSEVAAAAPPLLANRIMEQSSGWAREPDRARNRDGRKLVHVSSMGDERGGGGEFGVQLMRRSFSMDSAYDRQLGIAVQEMLRKNGELRASGGGEGSSGGGEGKLRRAFFSFSHSRSSKSSVLPVSKARR